MASSFQLFSFSVSQLLSISAGIADAISSCRFFMASVVFTFQFFSFSVFSVLVALSHYPHAIATPGFPKSYFLLPISNLPTPIFEIVQLSCRAVALA
jgi:hypothetical protein